MTYELVPGCPVCEHADRELIDEELAAAAKAKLGTGPGQIARRYGDAMSTCDVLAHVRHALPAPGPNPLSWGVGAKSGLSGR